MSQLLSAVARRGLSSNSAVTGQSWGSSFMAEVRVSSPWEGLVWDCVK